MTLNSIDQHKNVNGITVHLAGDDVGEGLVETGNTVTPGMIVTRGTTNGLLIPDNNTGKHSGWAMENMGTDENLLADITAGKRVRYGRNPGDKFMGLIASGQNLTKEAPLKTSSGKLVAFVAGTDGAEEAVARLLQEGGTGGALGADTRLLCKWGL